MSAALNESWTSVLALAPHTAKGRLRAIVPDDQEIPFLEFALKLAECGAAAEPTGRALSILMETGVIIRTITDPALSGPAEALRLARACMRLDRGLDVKILQSIAAATELATVMRALELIDAISDCRRLVMPLLKFARIADARIRSKAVKLMARASQNGAWLESILVDPDPRVRANMIEGLWAQLGPAVEPLLRRAARDSHHRVATTALLCLAKLGDQASLKRLEELTGDGREMHARAASWALAKLKER